MLETKRGMEVADRRRFFEGLCKRTRTETTGSCEAEQTFSNYGTRATIDERGLGFKEIFGL